jgi:hypothetical protein
VTLFAKYERPTEESAIRVLNRPRQVQAEADEQGLPRAIWVGNGWLRVEAIGDVWRIDDEWWRERISREYLAVVLDDGRVLTIFHDLTDGRWYAQKD